MPNYYFDSSAAVKKYVVEAGTAWVLSLFRRSARNTFYIGQIPCVEVVSAIARRFRSGNLTQDAAQKSIGRFKRDYQRKFRIIPLTNRVVSLAMLLSESHGLRDYDAVQLAKAVALENRLTSLSSSSIIFVSADDHLNQAAESEGLTIENPNRKLR